MTAARFSAITVFLGAACLASAGSLRAQAAAGPIHPPPQAQSSDEPSAPAPRPVPVKQYPPQKKENLVGAWKINPEESDDARSKIDQARNSHSSGNNPNGTGGNGPYGGGGGRIGGGGYPFPGSGGGGNGPYGRPGGNNGGESSEDRKQLQDLIDPATSLTFVQKDAEVEVTDNLDHKRVYYTDGRKLQKSKDANFQEASAHWEGARLVSDEKGPHGGKISRYYEVSPDGKQLYETVRLDSTHLGLITIRYVYDIAGASAAESSEQGIEK